MDFRHPRLLPGRVLELMTGDIVLVTEQRGVRRSLWAGEYDRTR